MESFDDILAAAIRDMVENGYDSAERVAYWQERLRQAAERMAMSGRDVEDMIRDSLRKVYEDQVDRGALLKRHPGLSRFTYEQIKPSLRGELDRRILAAADLIKINRREAIEKTLQRFSGWSTSIPSTGTIQTDKRAERRRISKALKDHTFVERRVLIDQGHKLISSINEIVAVEGGALAGLWQSHWREPNYNYRPEHKILDPDHRSHDQGVFIVRDNWAIKAGLMKKGGMKYVDEVPRPAELPFCRCYYVWIYNLRQAQVFDLLTEKGKRALAEAKAKRELLKAA